LLVVLLGGDFSGWFLGQVKWMVFSIRLFQMAVGSFLGSKNPDLVGFKTVVGMAQAGQ